MQHAAIYGQTSKALYDAEEQGHVQHIVGAGAYIGFEAKDFECVGRYEHTFSERKRVFKSIRSKEGRIGTTPHTTI